MVSIIIPNWNGKNVIIDCLSSIQKSTYQNLEVIVVDNASIDESIKIIRENFPKTRLIQNPINYGFARACNIGIQAALGQIIFLLNNDATISPSCISELLYVLENQPDIAIVSALVFYENPSNFVWAAGGRIDSISGSGYLVGRGQREDLLEDFDDIDYVPGCAVAIPKQIFRAVGFLNENYFFCCEDLDWAFCAKRLGYKIKLVNKATVWHKASITRRRNPSKGYFYQISGQFRIYFTHFPLGFLLTSLVFQLFLFPFFEVLVFRASPLYVAYRLRAFLWNILHLRQIMIERSRANSLGKLLLRNRFKKFMEITRRHVSSKSYDF